MQLQIREEKENIYVKIHGELDLKVADDLRQELDETLDKIDKKDLVLDFIGVDFIDSSGLGVILGRYKRLSMLEGKLVILNPNPNVKRILELSGITSLIEVKDSLEYNG